MKTIYIIILVAIGGLLFGLLLSKVIIKLSNWLLCLKTRKEILKKGLPMEELKRRNFFFKNSAYNLAEQIEYDLSKRTSFFKKIKNLFKKKVKGGISEYGNQPTDAGNPGFKREQVSTSGEGTKPTTAEQPGTDTAQSNGEQRDTSSNLS